jgi:hypothetical protein
MKWELVHRTLLEVYCASSFFSAKVGPPRHGELRLLASALGRMIKISAVLSPGTSDA